MTTKKLFQEDVTLKKAQAEVILSDYENGNIVLDQTIFFPEGGGQSCDTGTINDLLVIGVQEKDGIVIHKVSVDNSAALPRVGETVTLTLDWVRRFDNMQRHCGEHILSGVFYRECGAVNRGFHMGEHYMTIDMNLEGEPAGAKPKPDKIDWQVAMDVEKKANQIIWSDVPVTVRHFENRKEAAELPLRKALAVDEEISIVCVGDINDPADCVACCGTHPKTSGQVGLIKILKVENYKGMFRIYFEAGARALSIFDRSHEVLTGIGNRYSAGIDDLPEKISAAEAKNKKIRDSLYILKQSVIKTRIADIESVLGTANQNDEIVLREYDDLPIEDLLNIGRPLTEKIRKLLLIAAPEEKTVLLFSDGKTVDCGKLVKENASIYNGKGGGSKQNARAIFPNTEYMVTFIDLVEKHLRRS